VIPPVDHEKNTDIIPFVHENPDFAEFTGNQPISRQSGGQKALYFPEQVL